MCDKPECICQRRNEKSSVQITQHSIFKPSWYRNSFQVLLSFQVSSDLRRELRLSGISRQIKIIVKSQMRFKSYSVVDPVAGVYEINYSFENYVSWEESKISNLLQDNLGG